MRASPRMVTRCEIEREVWGDEPPDSDALRTHLYTLRKAVDRSFGCALIRTVPSAGYRRAPMESWSRLPRRLMARPSLGPGSRARVRGR